MHTALDVLHVVFAVFLVGPMAVLPMVALRDLRTGNAAHVGNLARSTNVFSILSLLVVVFGFGVLGTTEEKYDLSVGTPWVLASLICYLVALAVSLAVVVPALRQAVPTGPTTDAGTTAGAGTRAAGYSKVAMSSGVVSLLLLAVVVLMVWKP